MLSSGQSSDPCFKDGTVSLPCVKKLIQESNIQLFDVRSREEVAETGLIPSATNIPSKSRERALQSLLNPEPRAIDKTQKGNMHFSFN